MILRKGCIFFMIGTLLLGNSGLARASVEYMANKPKNGKTVEAPFPKGTGGSESFRIPAMVTLDSGRIVAAADARWNTTYDGGGLDTIVSYSDDKGKSWRYTFANYLGDNGNTYNGEKSTCFIDPCLVTDGKKLWLFCDLYPYGVALNGNGKQTIPQNVTGFDAKGNLLLSDNDHRSYDYYLNQKKGTIHKRNNGEVVENIKVDRYFNVTGGGVSSNLFFEDSPYKVQRTSYLYMISSKDGGATWSAPALLNLKQTREQAFLVAPGRGVYTKDRKIIVPCYGYNNANGTVSEFTCFIYSEDGGTTWKRSRDAMKSRSSESAVVELPNGVLRFFYRHMDTGTLNYVDALLVDAGNRMEYRWTLPVRTENPVNANCQLSAIVYSEPVQGKTAILISCPTGRNEEGSTSSTGGPYAQGGHRLNGKIFVGLLSGDWDNRMSWLLPMNVNENNAEFMYSCMTELKDGSVALLYEDHQNGWGAGEDKYYTMSYRVYTAKEIIGDPRVKIGNGRSMRVEVKN